MLSTLLCSSSLKPSPSPFISPLLTCFNGKFFKNCHWGLNRIPKCRLLGICKAQKDADSSKKIQIWDDNSPQRRAQQLALWAMEGVYVCWLFLLPYAPGEPVWAIKSDTITELVDLSLDFFFILPLTNFAGIHVLEAPTLHPTSEALFNFVIGWTLMFAPLLFTDCRRDRFRGSLDVLWAIQMFLTNTLLIPYMAIRLGDVDEGFIPRKPSSLVLAMTTGAPIVGAVGGVVCLVSVLWAFIGRGDGGFGMLTDRWEYFIRYILSDRLAYAFIWDICLYSIFQPWLIGDNLENVEGKRVGIVSKLRFIPVFGLVAYLLSLDYDGSEN